jgi:hypothetical protein
MFCPFCGDEVNGACPKAECIERMAAATATATATLAPPEETELAGPVADGTESVTGEARAVADQQAVVTAAPATGDDAAGVEQSAPMSAAPVVAAVASDASASIDDVIRLRVGHWCDIDAAGALLAKIEGDAKPVADAASGATPHPRLTSGVDLLAELRAVADELATELGRIGTLRQSVERNDREIARMKRNKALVIVFVVIAVVVLIAVIASHA